MAPRKRTIAELTELREPTLSVDARSHLSAGINLFNQGEYWHAHEAWEHLWLDMPDGPDGDCEIVIRGLIQLAAGMHLLRIERRDGAASNFRKAAEKLALVPGGFLGIEMDTLIQFARSQSLELDPSGTVSIEPLGRS